MLLTKLIKFLKYWELVKKKVLYLRMEVINYFSKLSFIGTWYQK